MKGSRTGPREGTSADGPVASASATAWVAETVTTSHVAAVPCTPAASGEGSTMEEPVPQPHQPSSGTTTPSSVSITPAHAHAIGKTTSP